MFDINRVSVPLRGKYRGKSSLMAHEMIAATKFPSPCGVNIVANELLANRVGSLDGVSVPLRGKYRGKSCPLYAPVGVATQGFRPLAG